MRLVAIFLALFVSCFVEAVEVPKNLVGKQIKYVLESTSGDFASYKGHIFETSFSDNTNYADIDLTNGLVNDSGTYHYFKTGDDTAELHYITKKEGPWKSMHFVEKLQFTSNTQGRVEGSHVGDIMCGYSGTFIIHDILITTDELQ